MKSRTSSTPLPHFSIASPYSEEPRLLLAHLLLPELSPSAGGVPDRAPIRGPPLRRTVVSGRRPPLVRRLGLPPPGAAAAPHRHRRAPRRRRLRWRRQQDLHRAPRPPHHPLPGFDRSGSHIVVN
uniref:Uncharacterized protein n=1 Tax=Triticum urartu TaxID=4572 RepID=A0A8R7V009_TRIUA